MNVCPPPRLPLSCVRSEFPAKHQELLETDDDQEAGAGCCIPTPPAPPDLRFETPQALLGMEECDRAEGFKDALQHVGRLPPSGLRLPIFASLPTVQQTKEGYEGGEYDPQQLGVACIVVPPLTGRGANTKGATFNLNPVRTPSLSSRPLARPPAFLSS